MMALHGGRQHGDPMVVGGGRGGGGGGSSSSIALLQERFRQLEKMREKREEMAVLKLLSESETNSKTKHYERLVHPEEMKARSSFQESLSLGLDLFGKKTEHQASKTPPFRDFWSMDSVTVSTSCVHEKPDVDTSLHL
ncbi:hypothetical protein Lser_V15G24913 [Lactuca serriola]